MADVAQGRGAVSAVRIVCEYLRVFDRLAKVKSTSMVMVRETLITNLVLVI